MNIKCRQGAGSVLVIVLIMLFIIASATIGRSLFKSHVADKTSKSVHGDLSLALGRNILKEGHLKLSLLANSTSPSTLFQSFRSDTPSFEEEIPLTSLPVSKAMLAQYSGYKLLDDIIEIKCISKYPSSKVMAFSHDTYGIFELSASIRHSRSGTFRKTTRIFGYRTTLTAAPVPLSNYTLMIGDGVFLINSCGIDNDANKTIDGALTRISDLFANLEEFKEKGDELKKHLDDKADSALPPLSGKYSDGAREVQKSIDILEQTIPLKPQIIIRDFGVETDTNPKALHYFAKPPMCLYSQEPQLNLEDINLPDKLKNRLEIINKKEKHLARDAASLKLFIDSKPHNLGPLSELTNKFCKSTINTAKAYEKLLLKDYKGFQDRLIEIGSTSYPHYLKAFLQLSKMDLLRKATAIISDQDDGTGRDVNQKLNDFLDKEERYNGLIFVLNGTTEIIINRKFKGRIFLVIERNLTIEQATIDDEKSDMLTICCLRHMALKGPVEASLIPWFSFTSIPGIPIKGNIIFSRINFISGPPEEVLAGSISYDLRLSGASGIGDIETFNKHQYVSISPLPLAANVERR